MIYVGKLDKEKLGRYKNKLKTNKVILTEERYNHIIEKHEKEYLQVRPFFKEIIYNPDYILNDNRHENTIILLKNIKQINKDARIVIKLALKNEQIFNKNSIITLMRLNTRTWQQTIQNRGNILYESMDKPE